MLNPQVWGSARLNRRVLNGMATSTVHPCASRCTAASHTPSQLTLTSSPSLRIRASVFAPSGLTWKEKAFLWSWKVSRSMTIESSAVMSVSNRMLLPRILDGSRSKQRIAK